MRQNRQSKVVAILALCVSVVGLTLGFAAFSNTLTISSSATVSPDETDFNINVYGITDFKGTIITGTISSPPVEFFTSETTSVANKYSSSDLALTASDSKITDNGKSITISDINVGLTEPGQFVSYYYMIKNEGEYDVYLDLNKYDTEEMVIGGYQIEGTCTAGEGTSETLVNEACPYVILTNDLHRYDYGELYANGYYVQMKKGEYIILQRTIKYESTNKLADGAFYVAFEDLTLEFTSNPPAE